MFKPFQYVECCNNKGAPELSIGGLYLVEEISRAWWERLIFGRENYSVGISGHDAKYYHCSHFRPVRENSVQSYQTRLGRGVR